MLVTMRNDGSALQLEDQTMMDAMLMPPPSKKLRTNDLSYVSPSQGTVFLPPEEEEQAEDDEESQSREQQHQNQQIQDDLQINNAPLEDKDDHDAYHHSSFSRLVSPESTLSSCGAVENCNDESNISSTGTSTSCGNSNEVDHRHPNHSQHYATAQAPHPDTTTCTCQQTIASLKKFSDAGTSESDSTLAANASNHSTEDAAAVATTATTSKSTSSTIEPPSTVSAVRTTTTTTRFDDIIGHGAVKVRMDELLLPLALPPAWTDSLLRGVRALPASLLLYGPPGCGKTQLARALAGESQAAFLSIRPSDVLSKFVGESEGAIRDLFAQAHELARGVESQCAVIFFDEVDALGCARGGEGGGNTSEGDGSRRILAELLIQMSNLTSVSQEQLASNSSQEQEGRSDDDDDDDTADDDCSDADGTRAEEQRSQQQADNTSNNARVRVLVIAATNRLADCDAALIRRFAIQIHVGLPTVRDRRKIFKKFLNSGDIDHILSKRNLRELAQATEGWSGSDLESLTREAAMTPIRECLQLAASTKRKMRKMEQRQQQGAESSRQEGLESPQIVARNVLWKEFQRLRPVTMGDFEAAIAFLLNASSNGDPGEGDEQDHRRGTYDDSSSSGSDDDDQLG